MLSSLDDGEDKPERTLLELVLLAESRGYKQAEEVRSYVCMYVCVRRAYTRTTAASTFRDQQPAHALIFNSSTSFSVRMFRSRLVLSLVLTFS